MVMVIHCAGRAVVEQRRSAATAWHEKKLSFWRFVIAFNRGAEEPNGWMRRLGSSDGAASTRLRRV
jgi:hypothetical protein